MAIAVIFQVLTQQYLHASFLLSGRNSLYLINTASIIVANVILSYVLVRSSRHCRRRVGPAGRRRHWICLRADPRRWAFPVPIPLGRLALTMIAGLLMALTVGTLDRNLHVSDPTACVVLVGVGFASYVAMCWLLDISRTRRRLKLGLALFRTKLANISIG